MDLNDCTFMLGQTRLHVKKIDGARVTLTKVDLDTEGKTHVTIPQAAHLVGFSPQLIYSLVWKDELKRTKVDGVSMIAVDDLNKIFT